MLHSRKVWNKLRAEYDIVMVDDEDLDDEVEGMVVLNPDQQVADHEGTQFEEGE